MQHITKYDAKYKGDFGKRLQTCEHLLTKDQTMHYDLKTTKVEAYKMFCRI